MKWIKYKVLQCTTPEGENVFIDKKIGHSNENLVVAQNEAYNGQYTIEEDTSIDGTIFSAIPWTESTEHPGCFYRMVGNEKEWLNPPMVDGVEYRTTKRSSGNPVYVKQLTRTQLGIYQSGSGYSYYIYEMDAGYIGNVISVEGIYGVDRWGDGTKTFRKVMITDFLEIEVPGATSPYICEVDALYCQLSTDKNNNGQLRFVNKNETAWYIRTTLEYTKVMDEWSLG